MKHAKLGNQKAFDLSFGFYKNLVGMESLVLFAPICKVNLGLESRSQETRDQVSLLLTDIMTPQLSDSSIRIILVLVKECMVKRAAKTCNLFCNIAAKRVEMRRC